MGLIALGLAMGLGGGLLGGEWGTGMAVLAMLPIILGAMLLLPCLVIALILGLIVWRARPDDQPLAAWRVLAWDGPHAVVMPAYRIAPQRYVWVDGVRRPVAWTEEGARRTHAVLDAPAFRAVLRVQVATAGVVSALVVGLMANGWASLRYEVVLEAEDTEVTAVPDGSCVA